MLSKKQKECLELMVNKEKKQKDIANEIHVHENTITNWKKNEEFMNEFDDMVKQSLHSKAPKAVKVLDSLLDANSENVRLLAAKDILDRTGFKPDDNINMNADMNLDISIDYGDGCDED